MSNAMKEVWISFVIMRRTFQAEETAGIKFSWWAFACNTQVATRRPPWLVGSEGGKGAIRDGGGVKGWCWGLGEVIGWVQADHRRPPLIPSEEELW